MVGCYSPLQGGSYYGNTFATWPDLMTDNSQWTGTFPQNNEADRQTVFPDNATLAGVWAAMYGGINQANAVLEAADSLHNKVPQGSTASIDANLYAKFRGEALFLRGLHYFNLVRLWGQPYSNPANRSTLGVPLYLRATRSADQASQQVPRNTVQQVYDQILKDLQDAEAALTQQREIDLANIYGYQLYPGRANHVAIKALLARVYLTMGEWQKAKEYADYVITEGGNFAGLSLVTPYGNVFASKRSTEAIFELQYSTFSQNALSFWYYPPALGGRREYTPTGSYNALFPTGDTRKAATIGSLSPTYLYGNKFIQINTQDDNFPIIRLGEMYLIAAEAANELGDQATALENLNRLRTRAQAPQLAINPDDPLTPIEQVRRMVYIERRLELGLEGHRWFDVIRTIDQQIGLRLITPGNPNWPGLVPAAGLDKNRLVLPIPISERDRNPAIVQNPGY